MTGQIFGFGGEVDVSLPRKWNSQRLSTGEAVVGILEGKGNEENQGSIPVQPTLRGGMGPSPRAVLGSSFCVILSGFSSSSRI